MGRGTRKEYRGRDEGRNWRKKEIKEGCKKEIKDGPRMKEKDGCSEKKGIEG